MNLDTISAKHKKKKIERAAAEGIVSVDQPHLMDSCSVESSRKRKGIEAKAQRMCILLNACILIAGSSDISTTAPEESPMKDSITD